MILLQLKGRLGNQMFQYAAARVLCEANGYDLACIGTPDQLLTEAFDLRRTGHFPLFNGALGKLTGRFGKMREYTPGYVDYTSGCNMEKFDSGFSGLPDETSISGWLQSPEYFQERRKDVLRWFEPREPWRKELEALERRLPGTPGERCCIHLRLTDYKRVDDGLAAGSEGWVMPETYYKHALEKVREVKYYLIVTDDPEEARQRFPRSDTHIIAGSSHPIVDLTLISRCRVNIIANSSFSWWGAWLNESANRHIIAPLYHTGWNVGTWVPDRIEVPGWDYVAAA